MTDETTLAPEEELARLATARDTFRKQRDAILDKATPEWAAQNDQFQGARRDWQRLYDRQAKRKQRTREAEQAALTQAETEDEWTPETKEEREKRELAEAEQQKRNRLALSPEERIKLDKRVSDFDRFRRMSKAFTDARWRMEKYDEQPGKDVPTPEMMNEAARELLLKYPPPVEEPKSCSEAYPFFITYGVPVDSGFIPQDNFRWPEPRPAMPAPTPTPTPPRPAQPAPVTNAQAAAHQENVTLGAEVHQVLTETPLQRFDRERQERVAAYQAQLAQLRGQQ